MTTETRASVHNPDLQAIIDAELPPLRNPALRREGRKEWAKQVRALFKSMGLKGISVTTPSYSMAHSIDIVIPRNNPELTVPDPDFPCYTVLDPAYRLQRERALDKVGLIIISAFPDLDDRSEYGTDYYDFCLSIS